MFASIAALSLVSDGWAAILQTQEDDTKFGLVGQNSAGINNGGVACGPTSVYNSFVYLQNQFGINGLLKPGAASNTINQLSTDMHLDPSGGVTSQQLVDGKTQYIKDQGLASKIAVESQAGGAGNVTAQFIYDQLHRGQDVEILFLWGNTNSGHFVTLTGINFDTTTHTGTLNFIDPWGNGGAAASKLSGTMSGTDAGGYTLTYTGGAAGDSGDPDNPGDGNGGIIYSVAAESPVPEPSTFALLGLGGVALAIRSYRRRQTSSV